MKREKNGCGSVLVTTCLQMAPQFVIGGGTKCRNARITRNLVSLVPTLDDLTE
jgi:hypothetical protein